MRLLTDRIELCLFIQFIQPLWFLVQEGEDAVQFANRVKAAIAEQGGFVDLLW